MSARTDGNIALINMAIDFCFIGVSAAMIAAPRVFYLLPHPR
jgi:hypothetical protein